MHPEHPQQQPPKERQRKTAIMLSVITCLFMGIMGYEIVRNNESSKAPSGYSVLLERNEKIAVNDENLPLKVLHAQNRLQAQQIKALKIELNETAHRLHEIQLSLLSAKQTSDNGKIDEFKTTLSEKAEENQKLQASLTALQVLIDANDLKMVHMEQTIDSLMDMADTHQIKKEKIGDAWTKRLEQVQNNFQTEKNELIQNIESLGLSQVQLKNELGEHSAEIVHLEEELAKNSSTLAEKEEELLSLAATHDISKAERAANEATLVYHFETDRAIHEHLQKELSQQLHETRLAELKINNEFATTQTILCGKEDELAKLTQDHQTIQDQLAQLYSKYEVALEESKNITLQFDQHKDTYAQLESELASLRVDHHMTLRDLKEQLASTQDQLGKTEEERLIATRKMEELSEQLYHATNRLDAKDQETLQLQANAKAEWQLIQEQMTQALAELELQKNIQDNLKTVREEQEIAIHQLEIALQDTKAELQYKNEQSIETAEKIAVLMQSMEVKEQEFALLQSSEKQSIENYTQELEKVKQQLTQTEALLETHLANLEETQRSHSNASNKVVELQATLTDTQQEHAEATSKIAELQTSLEETKREHLNAQNKAAELEVALSETTEEYSEANNKITELQVALEETKREYSDAHNRATELQIALSEITQENTGANNAVAELQTALNETKQEYSEANSKITELQFALEETKREHFNAHNKATELQIALNSTTEEHTDANNRIAELQIALEETKRDHSNAHNKATELQIALNSTTEEHADANNRIAELQIALEETKRDHSNAQNRAAELQIALEETKRDHSNAHNKAAELQIALSNTTQEHTDANSKIAELQASLEEAKQEYINTQNRAAELQIAHSEANSKIVELQASLENADTIELQTALNHVRKEHLEANNKLAELQIALENALQGQESYASNQETNQHELQSKSEEIQHLHQLLAQTKTEMQDQQTQAASLVQEIETTLAAANNSLDQEKAHKSEIEQQLNQSRMSLQEQEVALGKAREETNQSLANYAKEIDSLKEKLRHSTTEILTQVESIDLLKNNHSEDQSKHQQELADLERMKVELEHQNDGLRKVIEIADQDLMESRMLVARTLDGKSPEYLAMQKQFTIMQDDLKLERETSLSLEQKLMQFNQKISGVEEDLANARELSVKSIDKKTKELQGLQEQLTLVQKELRTEKLSRLAAEQQIVGLLKQLTGGVANVSKE